MAQHRLEDQLFRLDMRNMTVALNCYTAKSLRRLMGTSSVKWTKRIYESVRHPSGSAGTYEGLLAMIEFDPCFENTCEMPLLLHQDCQGNSRDNAYNQSFPQLLCC